MNHQPDFSDVPANQFFAFSLLKAGDGRAEITLPLKDAYRQEGDVVHGGIISTLADTTAVYALRPDLPMSQSMTSIEFKMNFLSPALIGNGNLRAVAQVVKKGRRIGVCEAEVYQKTKLIAKGLFSYLLLDAGSSKSE